MDTISRKKEAWLYEPRIGRKSHTTMPVAGVSHRYVAYQGAWVHTSYEDEVLTVREVLDEETVQRALLAASVLGHAITGPAMPDVLRVYTVREA